MMSDYTVEIESLDLEGRGVARRDGKAVFISGALPGELVTAEPQRIKPSYETGRLREVLRASSQRVTPRCPHFGLHAGACGGCSMQHLDSRSQVAAKQRVLEDTLWHIGRLRAENILRPVYGLSWNYRYRARLSVRYVPRKGGVLVGFHERGSSYVADMRECHVLPTALSKLLAPLRELVGQLTVRQRLPQIEVAVAAEQGEERIVLVLRILEPLAGEDHQLLQAFEVAHKVQLWLQPAGPHTAAPLRPEGSAELLLSLPEFGVALPFGPTDFTQVNHAINEVLVRRAVRLLAPRADDTLVDFFCGLGNFTLPLATRAGRVIGLEGAELLVRRAEQAARRNGLGGRTHFMSRNLFDWTAADWESLWQAHGALGAVLLDPPREGALAVVQALASSTLRPRRVVYVSCNPATLARDCAVLVQQGGWQLRAAGVVNMFPHTSHVESMALLEPAVA